MAILPHTLILKLHAAVVSAHLTSSRAALLGGIDPAFADGLPICSNASSQILSDLHGLNAAGQLNDGAVPFKIWLGNGLALVGQRIEADVFRSALAVSESAEAPTCHTGDQGSLQRVDEIAEELSRIGRAVFLARGDDLTRCLYEVDTLLARCPHHVEARMLRERIKRAVEEVARIQKIRSERGPIQSRRARLLPIAAQRRLRAPPSSFTGRQAELSELMSWVDPAGVLISAFGGTGKTALALELLQALAPRYPDLQIAIDLKGTSQTPLSPAAAMVEVISAFLPGVSLTPRAEELAGLYHAVLQGQRALLFLEDARDRAQIEPLLPPAGSVLLVTSRRRFVISGVHILSLGGLEENDALALLRRFAPRLDGDSARKIAELCGGSPLALRLAGGALFQRLDLSPEAYAGRLQDAQARYEQIDAALSVSFDLLDPVLQALWSRLGLFTSDFSSSTADALANLALPTLGEALSDLVAHGMLDYDSLTEHYSLHRAARRFAASRLDRADRVEAERQCESLQARSNTAPKRSWDRLLDRGELEVALSAARRAGQRHAEALYLKELAHSPAGCSPDHVELAKQALAIFRELGDHRGESQMLETLALLYEGLSEDRHAIDIHEQSLALACKRGVARRLLYAAAASSTSGQQKTARTRRPSSRRSRRACSCPSSEAPTCASREMARRSRERRLAFARRARARGSRKCRASTCMRA